MFYLAHIFLPSSFQYIFIAKHSFAKTAGFCSAGQNILGKKYVCYIKVPHFQSFQYALKQNSNQLNLYTISHGQ